LTWSTTKPVARRPIRAAAVVALMARAAPPRAERRCRQRDEMREHADLCHETEGERRRDAPEAPRAKRVASPAPVAAVPAPGGRRAWRVPVGSGADRVGPAPHDGRGKREQHRELREGGGPECPREAEPPDQLEERGRDDHAPERGPVEGEADREPPAALEPRSEDDIDRRAAHRAPADGHHEKNRIEMPRPTDEPEHRHAGRHRDRAARHDDPRPEALVHAGDRRGQERAGDVVHGDRRRHGRRRPSVELLEHRDVDRDPIEAETEAEERHHEGRGYHVPAVEISGTHPDRRYRLRARLSRRFRT
jgi:hypothetical protein